MNPRIALRDAILANDAERAGRLIREVDHTQPLADGRTPMRYAADRRAFECIEAMASNKKADSADKAEYGYALLETVKANRVETAIILLNAGASHYFLQETLTRDYRPGDSCLHVAARMPDAAPMVTLLLQVGFDTTLCNLMSSTPIKEAALYKRWDSVKALIAFNKPTPNDLKAYHYILDKAVDAEQLDIVALLLKAGVRQAGLQCINRIDLSVAIESKSSPKMMELLVSFGFDFSKFDFSADRRALYNAVCKKVEEKKNFKMALFVVLQSLRQPSSVFFKLPGNFSALIMSYLWLPKFSPEDKNIPQNAFMKATREFALAKNQLIKHNAKCFLAEEFSRFFRSYFHSNTSGAFLESDLYMVKDDQAASEFNAKKPHSETFKLLTKYKLNNLRESKEKNGDITGTVKSFLSAYSFMLDAQSTSEPFKQLLRELTQLVGKSCDNDKVSEAVDRFLQTGPELKLINLLERYGIVRTLVPVTIHTKKPRLF